MPTEAYIPCLMMQLPEDMAVQAARYACFLNPANGVSHAPAAAHLLAPLPPQKIAGLTQKLWPASGVQLTVQFLDNPDSATRNKILEHANAWGRTANIVFTETRSQGQVRLTRSEGGYWSYLGTDILTVPAGQATMNLQNFTASGTPDSEFYRVVRHEFGHTLGWPHEHMRDDIVNKLDPQKTVAYFQRTQGWDEQTTRQQVLTALSNSDLTMLPTDVRSIMCYNLPPEITKDGQPIPGGDDINDEDYSLAAKLYPKSGTAPPPPEPPPAGKLFSLDFSQHPVARGGKVTFYAPVAIPAAKYDVVPQSGVRTTRRDVVPAIVEGDEE